MNCSLLRASDDPELRVRDRDEQLSAMTWQASQQFEAGDFAAAERAYRVVLNGFPGDTVATLMLEECMERQGADIPEEGSRITLTKSNSGS